MISFYRKYRPQKVKELDLALVREFMERILTSGKFGHAYLFSGPKGTGKTSAARILAKVVNCEPNRNKKSKALSEPCEKCDSCRAIMAGTSLAVMEMDAASNRGIDDVRILRERIGLAPVQGSFTVYIIDEVHMLTTEAFNALLKTLEEPPEHAIFVLCTTQPEKLPETIISRCIRVNFTKANEDEVEKSLGKVIKGEKLRIEPEAVKVLAQAVDGSFRDGIKVLEQLAHSNKKITVEAVEKELGRGKGTEPDLLLTALARSKVKEALGEIDRLSQLGVDWQRFIKAALEKLRSWLRWKVGVEENVAESKLITNLSRVEIEWLIELLTRAALEMRTVAIAKYFYYLV